MGVGFSHAFGCIEPEDADLRAVGKIENGIRLNERLPSGLHDYVGAQRGELHFSDTLFEHIGAVIEFMVAEGHRIVAAGIHQSRHDFALRIIDEQVALQRVSGIEEEHVITFCFVNGLQLRHCGKAQTLFGCLAVAMGIVRVYDGKFCLTCR